MRSKSLLTTSDFETLYMSWWRHKMETFSALLALCAGNSPVPVNSPHKGQWRGALMFSLICAWINDWVNKREVGDLRRHRGHYDVNVMWTIKGNGDHDTEITRFLIQSNFALSSFVGLCFDRGLEAESVIGHATTQEWVLHCGQFVFYHDHLGQNN